MIKKGDILMYAECLEVGDDSCLMLALEDESTPLSNTDGENQRVKYFFTTSARELL